ncbi:MAG TPA: hydrogenase maturation protease [Pedococcus sp.]|nr:hydrogenase maturation protease [Pedococcus sp.]
MSRILVACVGNIFKSDDGFGVEVAARLAGTGLPSGVRLEDFGIRSVHLAYELMEGYDVLVLVDTVARQAGPPGTLYVIEPDLEALAAERLPGIPQGPVDAHDLPPGGVLSLLPDLGGSVDRVLVVGCRPETLDDGIGLSPAVAAAVDPAAGLVLDVVGREHRRLECRSDGGRECRQTPA